MIVCEVVVTQLAAFFTTILYGVVAVGDTLKIPLVLVTPPQVYSVPPVMVMVAVSPEQMAADNGSTVTVTVGCSCTLMVM